MITGGINDTATQRDVFKMSENLIRAGIQHEVMIYPNSGHGFLGQSGDYNVERRKQWFIDVLGAEL
jgi:dipeptidyl aminopeptidase/acylaminoacyl peptidase